EKAAGVVLKELLHLLDLPFACCGRQYVCAMRRRASSFRQAKSHGDRAIVNHSPSTAR
ncbi:hypothetical protein GW17_00052289, partial [Ensete ventricosum]